MLKIICVALSLMCLSSLVTSGCAQVGYCNAHGVDIKEGESAPAQLGLCYQNNCVDSQTNNVVTQGCPVYKLASYCTLSAEDLTKPYPQCCKQPICPPQSSS